MSSEPVEPPLPSKNWKLLEVRSIAPGGGRILSVANQKGGVGKTTTSVNLAAAMALRGHRILLVDLDPQANATTGVGLDYRSVDRSSYDLLLGEAALGDTMVPTAIPGLDCIPSSPDLAGAEIELVGTMARERCLAEALAGAESDYELIFLDCPPSLGLLTVNAMVAAQDLLVPVQCEYYALEGLGQLLTNAERVRRALNADLRVAGFLLTMYDARTRLSSQVADEVRGHFGDLVYKTVVPRSVRLSEAPSFGEPVLTLDPSSRGSISYRLVAGEVEARYGLRVAEEKRKSPATQRETPVTGLPPAKEPSSSPKTQVKAPPPPAESGRPPAHPGPGGRGYGTKTPVPVGLEATWPVPPPFTGVLEEAHRSETT